MKLFGLDAASDRRNFGYAIGDLIDGRAEVRDWGLLSGNAGRPGKGMPHLLAELRAAADAGQVLVAVDAPLGWPRELGAALATHRAGAPITTKKDQVFRRETERHLRSATGGRHRPLEVGADLIARAAHEALTVIAELRGKDVLDLPLVCRNNFEGAGLIEVYPAATLRACGAAAGRYKTKGKDETRARERRTAREAIASCLAGQIAGLERLYDASEHEFDAALCLLAGADFLRDLCDPIPEKHVEDAKKEGWIWVRSRERAAAQGLSLPAPG